MNIHDQIEELKSESEKQLSEIQSIEDLLIKHKVGATFDDGGFKKLFQDMLFETEKFNKMTLPLRKIYRNPPKLTSEYSQQLKK